MYAPRSPATQSTIADKTPRSPMPASQSFLPFSETLNARIGVRKKFVLGKEVGVGHGLLLLTHRMSKEPERSTNPHNVSQIIAHFTYRNKPDHIPPEECVDAIFREHGQKRSVFR